jgi:hypothetical protein
MHAHEKQPGPAAAVPAQAPAARPAAAPAQHDVLDQQRLVGNAAVVQRMQQEAADPQPSTVYDVLRAPGQPLHERVRQDMEARLGADFTDVRLHAGAAARRSAEELGARAYTAGSHVVLGPGPVDRTTLAHELAHVVQQRSGPVDGTDRGDGLRVSDPSDRHERAAAAAAASALAGPAPVPASREDHAGPAGGRAGTTRAGARPVVARMALLDRLRSAATREAELGTRFGIRIGPSTARPDKHFSHAELDRIEAALSRLPIEQVRDNPYLVAIQPGTGEGGAASAYNAETLTIDIVRPVTTGLVYSLLNRRGDWQRGRMDKGAMAAYGGISATGDRALGINPRDREVMGGVSDALVRAQGNLLKWTIRHEVGHPVERQVDWATLSAQPRFGGWQTFVRTADVFGLATQILGNARLSAAEQQTIEDDEGARLSTAFYGLLADEREDKQLDGFVERWAAQGADFGSRLTTAVGFVRMALAQPWTLPDGGASVLAIGPRVYHFSPTDTWVSYLQEQRTQHAVSNYQFSDPWEWFAEAYAAFNDPKANSEARDRLHPEARQWFQDELRAAFPAADQQAGATAPGAAPTG